MTTWIMINFILVAEGSPVAFRDVAMLVGIVLLAFFMLRITRRRIARSQENAQERMRKQLDQSHYHQASTTSSQLNELMAALADLARQINGQLDTRIAKLDILIQQADERIRQLGGEPPDEAEASGGTDLEDVHQAFDELENRTTNPKAVPARAELSPEEKTILELTEKGYSSQAIAQELQRPIGEIDLMLRLLRKKCSPDS